MYVNCVYCVGADVKHCSINQSYVNCMKRQGTNSLCDDLMFLLVSKLLGASLELIVMAGLLSLHTKHHLGLFVLLTFPVCTAVSNQLLTKLPAFVSCN